MGNVGNELIPRRIHLAKPLQHFVESVCNGLGFRICLFMKAKIEKIQEMFNKDIEDLRNKQTEMNNTITDMKTKLEGINSRITEAEERISDLEDRMVEFTAAEQNKEKRMKRNEDSLRDLWENIKCTTFTL